MSPNRRFLISVFFSIVCFVDSAIAAPMPVGIPSPASSVPDAIMPRLPSKSSQVSAFPYDPIEMPTPTWVDGSRQYYIDNLNSNCSDSANGGHGNPETPRCTIPGLEGSSWSLSAGEQLFIAGNGAQYGNARNLEDVRMIGEATAPIWVIGVGNVRPELRFERFSWRQGRHVIFDGVHFRSPVDNFRMKWSDASGQIEYFTFRNLSCSGSDGVHSEASRRCFSIGGNTTFPLRFVVFHNLDVWGLGRWQDDRVTGRDLLGFQVQKWARYVWILNSRIKHIQGDSIMCGNSNWFDYDYASRPHYVYIGGNELSENYENAYDQKGCYHVVFSENNVHDFFNSKKGANETAIITEQDSEGDIGGRYTWFLNNVVQRAGTAFGARATTSDAYIYIVGNVVADIRSAALEFTQRCYSGGSAGVTCPLGLSFVQNTVDCGLRARAVTNPQNPVGSNQQVEIDSNIFLNCTDGAKGSPHVWESYSVAPLHIIYKQNAHFRSSGGNISLPLDRIDVFSAQENSLNQDIQFSATGDSNYQLLASSPAYGLVETENGVFTLFQSLYGIDIRRDMNGNIWGSPPISAGAFQEGGLAAQVRPNPPIRLD